MTLKVKVDRDKCQGHARCAALAPELFELDELGNAREKGDGTVPDALVEKAYLAKANCPEDSDRGSRRRHETRPPVNDWSTDFDHLDPRWIENPYPIWDELREKCPIAHTERFRGVYFPSRYEDVRAVAYDTENFSSRRIIVRETPPPRIPAPPITSDPPEHRPAKNLLLPAFTPDAIKRYESTRATSAAS